MPQLIRIGRIEVDLDALEASGPGGVHRIEPRAAAVLAYLWEHRGQVVSRDELLRAVWGHPHVSKDTLAVAVHRLRQALAAAGGASAGESPVETVPRRGYRLRPPPVPARRRQRRAWTGAGALAAAAFLAVIFRTDPGDPALDPDGLAASLARAEALWERRQPGALRRARQIAADTLATVDPQSETAVRAHSLLGRIYGYKTAEWLGLDRRSAADLGRDHLDRALAVAPEDPEVLTSAASFALYTERDRNRAWRLARRALALAPDGVATQQVYAKAAAATGRAADAVSAIEAAAAAAPADGGVQWDRAFLLYLAGRHRESIEALEAAVALSPQDPYWLLAFNYHALSDHREAAAVWADHMRRNGCGIAPAEELAETFRRLLSAEAACPEQFAYHRGLWAYYAGDLALAQQHFEEAQAEEDYMYIWRALNPLPDSPEKFAYVGSARL